MASLPIITSRWRFWVKLRPNASPTRRPFWPGISPQMPAPTITLGPVDFFGRAENAILILRALCNPPLDALHNALAADAQACGLPSIPARSPRTSPSHGMRRPRLKRWPPFPYPRFPLAPKSAHLFLSARDDADALRYTPLFSADFASFVSL